MTSNMAAARADQIKLIDEPVNRDQWLAAEIDGVELETKAGIAALAKSFSKAGWMLFGVLVVSVANMGIILLTAVA